MAEWWEEDVMRREGTPYGNDGVVLPGARDGNTAPTSSGGPVDRAPVSMPSYTDIFNPVMTGSSPSALINQRNPSADPGQPFVQAGDTGGYLAGIGPTIGEGRSLTAQQAQSFYDAANAKWGQGTVDDFLRRNAGDFNRIDEALMSEWMGAGQGQSREQSEALQRDPRTALSRPGATSGGQTWGGENWFTDPATAQLETLIKGQLNQLSNPGANDPQTKLMDFLMGRFDELSGSNGYSPQELAMLHTQALEPIETLRGASQKRETERTARAGYLPSSGLTRLNQQQNDLDYDRLRTQASRDLAVQNVNERTNRLNQAVNLGQTALTTQRGTQGNQLQLATLLQQLPVQALQQALGVLGGSTSPESLLGLVNQMTAVNNQNQAYTAQQNQQLWGAIGSILAGL